LFLRKRDLSTFVALSIRRLPVIIQNYRFMRKFGFAACLLGLVSLGLFSCSDDSDEEWRDDNLAFFDNLANKEDLGIFEIGDTINGFPGLYYTVKKMGTGITPVIGNQVNVIYAGWLWNDTTTYKSILDTDDAFDYCTKATTFTVGSTTIEGFSLALQSMPVGSKWRVFIPYYLGYGSSGSTSVSAYSTLIFDIYLQSIESEN
jgi:FKBP-type peptidyl-prolyl cis-trans isomerase FklB